MSIDWPRRKAYVEPTELRGRSQWRSAGQPLQFALCRAAARVLAREEPPVTFSRLPLDAEFIAELKFGECLPPDLKDREINARYDCFEALALLARLPIAVIRLRDFR